MAARPAGGVVSAALTLALPKGRLLEPALTLLGRLGVTGLDADSRRLLVADPARELRFIFLKPADIPTYVQYGAADLGIVGKDILAEQGPDVYEPVDLGFGFCRLVVAEARELWERDDPSRWSWVRVATKYPALTEEYFSARGIQVEMVRLDGSIELAPLVGLAERIVDLVQSGETLRANGLVEVAQIMTSTARLIVNRAALKTAHARVNGLIEAIRREVAAAPAATASGRAAS
jgi:ATP phosphoribosyltransferase